MLENVVKRSEFGYTRASVAAIQKLSIIIIYQVRLWCHSVVTRGAYFCHCTTEYTVLFSPALPLVLCREYSTLTVVCYGKSSSKLHGKQQILYQPVLIQTATTRKRWDKKQTKNTKTHTSVSSATAFFLTIFPAARALHTARTKVTH